MRGGGIASVLGMIAVLVAGGCDGDVTGSGGGGASSSSAGQGGDSVSSSSSAGQGGGPFACANDAECGVGTSWCVNGTCVPCDNSGMVCDIACPQGWTVYERNGCTPCECAPINECTSDAECPPDPSGASVKCYAGQFCWDWCPAGDPSCCYGNACSLAGCPDPNPTGCHQTGCPQGEACVDGGCAPSSCFCDAQGWGCTDDCGGGSCVPPP